MRSARTSGFGRVEGRRPLSVQLYAFECGRLEIPHAFLLEGAKGKIQVPIPSYLIVHPKGRILFDSGLNLATQSDPET